MGALAAVKMFLTASLISGPIPAGVKESYELVMLKGLSWQLLTVTRNEGHGVVALCGATSAILAHQVPFAGAQLTLGPFWALYAEDGFADWNALS